MIGFPRISVILNWLDKGREVSQVIDGVATLYNISTMATKQAMQALIHSL